MKVAIDRSLCISSGNCVRTVPALFRLGPDGIATLAGQDRTGADDMVTVPVGLEVDVDDAVFNCPMTAIEATGR